MSEKKYVPQGVFLTCDKGATPSKLRITQQDTDIYDVPLATEADKLPFLNIKPFGPCKAKGFQLCVPVPIAWVEPQEGVTRGGFRLLTNESTLPCILSGKIEIHYTQAAANAVTWGGGLKKPTEYITDGFDKVYEQAEAQREQRDSWLPGWMQPVADVADWTNDLGTGLVEGAVNGVVGLGETAYQVYQDPVGTGEALGGMVKDGWNAGVEGAGNAWDWASEGENWSNAADGAWNWASDGDNWVEAGQGAWNAAGDAAGWVAENPRAIGNVAGEFIPDAAAAYFSGGTSLAASGARVAGKEIVEEVVEETVEKAVREAVEEAAEEGVEKAAKEAAEEASEEAAEKAAKEAAEEAAEEVPEVVVRQADEITQGQKEIIDDVENGNTDLTTNKEKGNYGEMKMDDHMVSEHGLEPIHDNRVTSLDQKIETGIDGVYRDADGNYVIGEAKYNTSRLGNPADGPQMSDDWIQGSNRIERAVGDADLADDILMNGYDRVLTHIAPDGTITTSRINAAGEVVGSWP